MSFYDLIYQLSEKLETDLQVDGNGVCQIVIDNAIALQLEPDAQEENLLIASPIFELPPGPFRQDVLKAALQANTSSMLATLACKDSTLILFNFLSLNALHIDTLAEYLSHFLAIALDWKTALDEGRPSPNRSYLEKKPDIDLTS